MRSDNAAFLRNLTLFSLRRSLRRKTVFQLWEIVAIRADLNAYTFYRNCTYIYYLLNWFLLFNIIDGQLDHKRLILKFSKFRVRWGKEDKPGMNFIFLIYTFKINDVICNENKILINRVTENDVITTSPKFFI